VGEDVQASAFAPERSDLDALGDLARDEREEGGRGRRPDGAGGGLKVTRPGEVGQEGRFRDADL
jgi:hypothetical protein